MLRPARHRILQHTIQHRDATPQTILRRHRHDFPQAFARQLRRHHARARVVDADDRVILRPLIAEDAPLGADIAVHAAMAREMIRRDVQHHSHIALQALSKIQLIARQLQHIDRRTVQPLEIEHAHADIAADAHVFPARFQDMTDQRRRRRLAVRARDADDPRPLEILELRDRARKQLHVADHRHAHHLRHAHEAMRLGEFQRDARRENQRREVLPVAPVEVDQRHARSFRRLARSFVLVPRTHARAASHQGARRRDTRPAKAQYGDVLPLECADWDQAGLTSDAEWQGRQAPAGRR